jgi:AraC-like DNA-binding protein
VSGGVPHLVFDSADYPAGEGRGRWEGLIGAYDVAVADGQPETDFAVRSESWLLGEMVVTRGRLTAVELRRSAERIAADGRDTFTFGLVTRGLLAGDFDGQPCELRPGQVCIIDFARPWRAWTEPTEFILVAAPRAPLLALAPRAGDLHGRLLDGATARILAEHIAALVRHLPQACGGDVTVIQRTTLRMIAESLETLAPGEPSAAADARVVDRVRRYVEDRLAADGLFPATICAELGISRPTLYRAFRASGGVAKYVQRRRLEAVHVLLSEPSETRSLSDLALAYGFSSHAHFTTAFRRRFGYTPRDARMGGGQSAGAAALQFRSWMLSLASSQAR